MKAELNQELKEKFFATYWGQRISYYQDCEVPNIIDGEVLEVFIEDSYLLLRPLSSISDNEMMQLCKIMDSGMSMEDLTDMVSYKSQMAHMLTDESENAQAMQIAPVVACECFDYLRSKGFAVPYCGHSVESLVEAGWVKIKNENE